KGLYASVNLSTGYRNPNIDDLTKLFESVPGIKYVVPNTDLKPESTRTLDVGLRYVLSDRLNIEGGVYQTQIKNLLIDMPASLNGSDSVNYAGQNTRVFRMENAASGFVRGAYLGGKAKLVKNLYTDFYYAVTYGRYKSNDVATEQPLDHIAPNHGRVGLRYAKEDLQLEAFMLFNGWKLAKDYSLSGEDNANQAPNGTTPSWETYNIRASYALKNKVVITLAAENLLDLNYRVFASGISAPGRNIIASVRVSL
ncbi:MAG: TonB-dependent receptor, partial [Bacteroidia bacterium]|nr:TonB-dependent receptor [Bacteroidia bacterium]